MRGLKKPTWSPGRSHCVADTSTVAIPSCCTSVPDVSVSDARGRFPRAILGGRSTVMASRTLCRVGANVLLRRMSPAVAAPLMTRTIVVAVSPFTVRSPPHASAVSHRTPVGDAVAWHHSQPLTLSMLTNLHQCWIASRAMVPEPSLLG